MVVPSSFLGGAALGGVAFLVHLQLWCYFSLVGDAAFSSPFWVVLPFPSPPPLSVWSCFEKKGTKQKKRGRRAPLLTKREGEAARPAGTLHSNTSPSLFNFYFFFERKIFLLLTFFYLFYIFTFFFSNFSFFFFKKYSFFCYFFLKLFFIFFKKETSFSSFSSFFFYLFYFFFRLLRFYRFTSFTASPLLPLLPFYPFTSFFSFFIFPVSV